MDTITHRGKKDNLKYSVWSPFGLGVKVEAEGDLATFIFALAGRASDLAPNIIKMYFSHKDVELPSTEDGSTLYLLSQGLRDGKHYSCFATSGNKYLKDNYMIRVSNEPYPVPNKV